MLRQRPRQRSDDDPLRSPARSCVALLNHCSVRINPPEMDTGQLDLEALDACRGVADIKRHPNGV
jgi:hypothetical protein